MNDPITIPQTTDIVIAGGGPAGCCAALRLLEMGYRVVMLEAAVFPRFQIGEVLTPGAVSMLGLLHCESVLAFAGCTRCPPSRVVWETQTPDIFHSQGYLTDRAKMDQALLREAVSRGAILLQPARYISCSQSFDHPDYSDVAFVYQNKRRQIRCRFLLDAGGRSRHRRTESVYLAPDTIALWNQWEETETEEEVLMEAVKEGWLWYAPIANRKNKRLVAVLSPASLQSGGVRESVFQLIKQSSLFGNLTLPADNWHACPATPAVSPIPWSKGIIRIGDSAFATDPLSSSGVEKSIRSALQVTVAINTIIKTGIFVTGKNYYEDCLIQAVISHSRWTREYYGSYHGSNSSSFWEKRADACAPSIPDPSLFYQKLIVAETQSKQPKKPGEDPDDRSSRQNSHDFLRSYVHVSPTVKYVIATCVVGDLLEERMAAECTVTGKRIAFIKDIDVIPFLMRIDPQTNVARNIEMGCHLMCYHDAYAIMQLLVATRFIILTHHPS